MRQKILSLEKPCVRKEAGIVCLLFNVLNTVVTGAAEAGGSLEFETSLVYIVRPCPQSKAKQKYFIRLRV